MQNRSVGFIGAGNMASAIIKGLLKQGRYEAKDIFVYDIAQAKRQEMAKLGLSVLESGPQVAQASDMLVLAIKPQQYADVLETLRGYVKSSTVVVSIAAGISIAYVRNGLALDCPVVRAMPNTPLLLGQGATALCRSAGMAQEDFDAAAELFAASGDVAELTEDKMNAVISVNGSSPAYIYLFAKAMVDYAAGQGIPEEEALRLVCKTLEGSAAMLRSSGHTPGELIDMVCSPGGTTLAAMQVLNDNHFADIVQKAMQSCTTRAEELGK